MVKIPPLPPGAAESLNEGGACFSGKVRLFQQFQCQERFLFFNDLDLS
jgi:hypothetical protein